MTEGIMDNKMETDAQKRASWVRKCIYFAAGMAGLLFGLDQGVIIGSLVGSSLISIICIKAVHWFHVPHHILSIPSVIPMVPGVLMYRALFGLIEMQGVVGELTEAFSNGVKASLITLCIAIGVAIPNIFARQWIAPNRRRKLNYLIAERKAKGKFLDLNDIK